MSHAPSRPDTITIAHIFYGQHRMLPFHNAVWDKVPHDMVRHSIIDDCSPRQISEKDVAKQVDVYRVTEDIPWNIAGARNLCFHTAQTEWVLCADIDHVVTPDALKAILDLDRTDPNVVYIFSRRDHNGRVGVEAIINMLMSKEKYFEVGGHDEDFSGHYGKEETFFRQCLRARHIRVIRRDDIVLEWHPRLGATTGLSRDRAENDILFERKMKELKAQTYRNGPLLRFGWERAMPMEPGRTA